MNNMYINKGKRSKRNGNNRKKTLGIIIVVIAIIIIITLLIILKSNIFKQDNNNITDNLNTIEEENLITVILEPTPQVKQDEIVSVEDMPKTMIAKTNTVYYVVGKIVIDKIGVEKYILDRTTDNSLNLAVTSFVPERKINEVGNFCITGHNYKGIFKNLTKLEKGDEFYLVGADGRKVTYVIYDKYSIYPKFTFEEEECLQQNNNGKREVTLITCEPGAVKRLILKAEEKI